MIHLYHRLDMNLISRFQLTVQKADNPHARSSLPPGPESVPRSSASDALPAGSATEWLLLIHQLPTDPAYLRVKLARRLKRIGAVQLKSSVYVLPATDEASEDFRWLLGEIVAGGGEAT